MTKYIIEESTLTGMADQIRALTGTTGPLKPGEMVTKIETSAETQEENLADLAEQDELIEQIFTALEGKAGGGSSVELCTLSIVLNYRKSSAIMYYTVPDMSTVTSQSFYMYSGNPISIPKNTIICFCKGSVGISGNYNSLSEVSGNVYIICGDCTITITG